MEEAGFPSQYLLSIANSPSEYTAEHVAATVIGGTCSVCDRDRQRTDVVGHHTIGHVHIIRVIRANLFNTSDAFKLITRDKLAKGQAKLG